MPSIIMEPRSMFQTLQEMEQATKDLIQLIKEVTEILEAVSILTFAIGFGELIKMAEQIINQVGNAVVAANNAFNSACREVVQQLVDKFAPEGAKPDYSSPPFTEITIRINSNDKITIEPSQMRNHLNENQQKNSQIHNKTTSMGDIYQKTSSFWIGESADKTRHSFQSKIMPEFENLKNVLDNIVSKGMDWITDAEAFENALGV